MSDIISRPTSIIIACDSDPTGFERILRATGDVPEVGAYKIGASLGLAIGLGHCVSIARRYTTKPLIYDHQKAGTDIPDTGAQFVQTLKQAGVSAFIIFPLSGPETERTWLQAARDMALPVIVGAHMTHPQFLASDGGYIQDAAVDKIVLLAAENGVTDFVVPGNQPDVIRQFRSVLEKHIVSYTFYAPGFVTQGGELTQAAQVAGPRWHAIVGRAIQSAQDPRAAVLSLAAKLPTHAPTS